MIKAISQKQTTSRTGATLTEVLMSMLIMSVGVSFVAAVFPLALLKSVQSAQLTNATILVEQARSLIDMMPNRLLHNPNGDPLQAVNGFTDANPLTFSEHFGSNYIVDPWGYFIHTQDDSIIEFPVPGEMLPPFDDPDVSIPSLSGFPFGNRPAAFPGARALMRYDGGIRADTFTRPVNAEWERHRERLAATLSSSTDRWDDTLETDNIVALTSNTIEFGADVDLSGIASRTELPTGALIIPDPELARITLFHEDGRTSQAYPITLIDGNVIHWGETAGDFNVNGFIDARPLPENYFIGARPAGAVGLADTRVSHVLIETSLIRQFSWFLTVRKDATGGADVDAAVVFNRAVNPVNEYAYRAVFPTGTNQVLVDYDSTEPEPFLKKGGYVFDANNAEWYRVRDVQEPGPGPYEAALTVERVIRRASGEDLNGNGTVDAGEDANGDGVQQFGTAIFLPGVIEVFPMGKYSLPEDVL